MSLIVRPGILDIAAYVPGDHSLPGEGPVHRMASNESALGASPQAIEAYRALAAELHRYPDGASKALRAALGRDLRHRAPTRSSAAPAPTSCCTCWRAPMPGRATRCSIRQHGFLIYPIAAKAVGATPVTAPETGPAHRRRRAADGGDAADRASASSPIRTTRPAATCRARS